MDIKKAVSAFKALSDENRINILKLLVTGEKCACKLLEELNISQPTLSHHMKILCDSGIVSGRKEGKWMHYSIDDEGVKVIQKYFDEITSVNARELNNKNINKPCCDK